MVQYRNLTDEEDLDAANAIMESLERRWAVTDQQIFIASVILNPFYQGRPFAQLYFLNNAGIHALLGHLWSHFFNTEPSQDFHTELTGIPDSFRVLWKLRFSLCKSQSRGAYKGTLPTHTDTLSLTGHNFQAEHPDPLSIYIDFLFAGQPPTPFI
jgi:hypothetical protein